MLSGFVGIICRVAIFMICAQAIVHFRPKASYEKYLKMLISIMILIWLFQAAESLFSPEEKGRLAQRAQWFAESLDESMQEAAAKSLFSEEDLQITGQDPRQTTSGETLQEGREGERNAASEITVQIAPVEQITVESVQGNPE